MLVRRVQRAYPSLRTERTHGLSPRICKHQFSDWTSLQVKETHFPNKHTAFTTMFGGWGDETWCMSRSGCDFLRYFGAFSLKRGFNG